MSSGNIRHRAAAKPSSPVSHHSSPDSSKSGDNNIRHNKTLHAGVWARIVLIIGLFTLLVLFISRIGASRIDSNVVNDGAGIASNIRVGGLKSNDAGDSISNALFVTIVMPSVVKPEARPLRLTNIAKTWGPHSRAIYVVHDTTEYPEGKQIEKGSSSSKSYPQLLLVPDHITVEKGVERIEHVIRTVHTDINPDFAFFVNDHTFVLPDHLCKFLKENDSTKDLYAGHVLKGKREGSAFNSGAAGYVLSRKTMERLIAEWDNPQSKCSAANASKWLQGNPGILTAQCFDQVLHVPVLDTRDPRDLSHKFHAYGILRTVTGKVDDWYLNKHEALDNILGEDEKYHHKPQHGVHCCSIDTISFHYVEAGESIAFWDVMQQIHKTPTMSSGEIQKAMNDIWPRDKDGLGGYSQGLPGPHLAVWKDIVSVVRKISVGVAPPSC